MVQIKKRNESLQDFQNEKIVNSCIKAGASKDVAEKIAADISSKVKDGMSTAEIKGMVANELRSVNAMAADTYLKYVKSNV